MIRIKNLSFSYGSKTPLFEQLNLTLPVGNIYGLLGKNGAGKSTLLKIMSGLVFPSTGNVEVLHFNPKDRYPQFLSEIYFIPEEFELPALSIQQYVKLYSPFYSRFSQTLFESYALEFQLEKNSQLTDLSYGQKKKFLLSFGLATDCQLVIFDEPTNGLDIPSKSQFRKIVASAIHDERTFIISTHQVRDMENLIDPIIILDGGQIVFNQSIENVTTMLSFTRQTQLPDAETLVFAESSLGGYSLVLENRGKTETHVNLELLFKAVINDKEKIHQLFNA